jgi:hypothetical protein
MYIIPSALKNFLDNDPKLNALADECATRWSNHFSGEKAPKQILSKAVDTLAKQTKCMAKEAIDPLPYLRRSFRIADILWKDAHIRDASLIALGLLCMTDVNPKKAPAGFAEARVNSTDANAFLRDSVISENTLRAFTEPSQHLVAAVVLDNVRNCTGLSDLACEQARFTAIKAAYTKCSRHLLASIEAELAAKQANLTQRRENPYSFANFTYLDVPL